MSFLFLRESVAAYRNRDSTAYSDWVVLTCYAGLRAVLWHRVAYRLWRRDAKWLARWLAYRARCRTGIEIHPSARIGRRLVIDHGMGIVIGATAEIGDDVYLLHGVTMGTVMRNGERVRLPCGRRHPKIGDDVMIGAGAVLLGPITVGNGAKIGANAVVLRDVAPGETVVGVPARPTGRFTQADPGGTPPTSEADALAAAQP